MKLSHATTWLLAAVLCAPLAGAQEGPDLEDPDSQGAYAFGVSIGRTFAGVEAVNLDIDAFMAGMQAALGEEELALSDEELAAAAQAFQQKIAQARQAEQAEEAQAFLDLNKGEDGVTETDSGLQYKVLEEGDGASPTPSDRVRVHYTGTLADGTVFDSSRQRGEPVEFQLGQVIPGWTEGLQLMEEGARYEFTIPPDLGYGARGRPPQIPGNSVLVFDVELLDVNPPQEPAQPQRPQIQLPGQQ